MPGKPLPNKQSNPKLPTQASQKMNLSSSLKLQRHSPTSGFRGVHEPGQWGQGWAHDQGWEWHQNGTLGCGAWGNALRWMRCAGAARAWHGRRQEVYLCVAGAGTPPAPLQMWGPGPAMVASLFSLAFHHELLLTNSLQESYSRTFHTDTPHLTTNTGDHRDCFSNAGQTRCCISYDKAWWEKKDLNITGLPCPLSSFSPIGYSDQFGLSATRAALSVWWHF